MGKNLLIGLLVIALALVAFFAVLGSKSPPSTTQQTPEEEEATESADEAADEEERLAFDLDEQNDSSVSGTAILEEEDSQVIVTLVLEGAPEDVAQPAHIHAGSCPDVGAVVFPLESPVNGESETTLDITFDDLREELPLAINVHKSARESQIYVACGNLPL